VLHEYIQRKTPYCVAVLNSRTNRFEWYKTLAELNISALHLLDETYSWYHNCLDEARELVDKYKPVRLAGSSMGGYAALLLGSLHDIHVKAFAPQTTIAADWDKRWTPEWDRIRDTTKYPEYRDLSGLEWKVKPDIYYCFGSKEDVQHVGRIKRKVNRFPRECLRHEDAAKGIDSCEIFRT
jgi:pimeloyl-ACP methyl ester carboxylesterase